MAEYVTTELSDDGVIATLTFSDPERGNQICWAAIDEIADALQHCRQSRARVVILTCDDPEHWLEHAWLQDLCAGVEGQEQTGSGAGWHRALGELANETVISIAAISGSTSGGGAELGWACDLRIAEKTARFTQPEINMGLTTGIGGCSRLMRLAGVSTTTAMVMSGEPMAAERLYDLGALTRLVEAGESLATAQEMAGVLAAKSPQALAAMKRILRNAEQLPLAESLAFEQQTFQETVVSPQAVSGMKAVQAAYENAVRG